MARLEQEEIAGFFAAPIIREFAEKMAREFEQIAARRVQITPEQADTYREAAEHLRGRARYLTDSR